MEDRKKIILRLSNWINLLGRIFLLFSLTCQNLKKKKKEILAWIKKKNLIILKSPKSRTIILKKKGWFEREGEKERKRKNESNRQRGRERQKKANQKDIGTKWEKERKRSIFK